MCAPIVILIILAGASATESKTFFREDYDYDEKVNGWFKLHKVPANWHDARLRCRAEGASLLSPSTAALSEFMALKMLADSFDLLQQGIYSGIHSTFSHGDFFTIEGMPVNGIHSKWLLGQPDNVDTEDCVVFYSNYTLANVKCSDQHQFLCYKAFQDLPINKCNTVDSEYKWDARTEHCYKFHNVGATWSRAHMICAAEGGHLAIINSDVEAEVLKDIFAQHPRNVIQSMHKDSAMIGFREWFEERAWFTIHGQTLAEAGYSKWSEGQPDHAISHGEGQNCGAIWRTALLDDIWCNEPFAFICEKS